MADVQFFGGDEERAPDNQQLPGSAPLPGSQAPSGDLAALNQQYGFAVDDDWERAFNEGRLNYADLKTEMDRRAGATASNGGRGGDADLDENGAIDPGWTKGAGGQYTFGPSAATTQSLAARGGTPYPYAGNTFSDPWTGQLEQLITSQLNAVTNPPADAAQTKLMQFLMQRFGDLSSTPGYSDADRALLNTQALEPIEALRQASNKRVLERASARGFLPSSGLVQDEYAQNDRYHDQLRTVANRDLAVNAITKRTQDVATAAQLGQAATAQEQAQRNQALSLATLLYQLPINAQNQALAVINGTGGPQSLLPYVVQMAQAGQQNNAQFWNSLGMLAGLGI